ncbi:MAG: response regulator [Aggregatilineales bacterium]
MYPLIDSNHSHLPIKSSTVLIVDDMPDNLMLLTEILRESGHRLHTCNSGKSAVIMVEDITPDLILLDVNMPEMDGYEVCRHLKNSPDLADVPIIFLSAMDSTLDKVKAFRTGGVDYITKPFEVIEVLARVETQLAIYHQRKEINRLRQKDQLIVEKLTNFVTDTLKNTSHDLKNPLSGINISVHLLERHGRLDDEQGQDYLSGILRDVQRMSALIEDLITVAKVSLDENDEQASE